MRVDHHFWDSARADDPFLTEQLAAIRPALGPDDLAPLIAAVGIGATIVVQARSKR